MNRRRFLIALAILIPVALFIPAKIAASWRPVKMGAVPLDTTQWMVVVQTSGDLVSVLAQKHSSDAIEGVLFRASTDELLQRRGRLVGVGEWSWGVREADVENQRPRQIVLHDGTGRQLVFDVPASSDWETKKLKGLALKPGQSLELVAGDDYLGWSLDAPASPRQVKLARRCYVLQFMPDEAAIVTSGADNFWWLSTLTGKVIRRVSAPDPDASNWISLSGKGNYSVANSFDPKATTHTVIWNVVGTRTGRNLWSFQLQQDADEPVLAPDETVIALPFPTRGLWEIRNFQTGKTLRTLPLLSGTQTAAFSPDGDTLYSVANGTLYRQRAR